MPGLPLRLAGLERQATQLGRVQDRLGAHQLSPDHAVGGIQLVVIRRGVAAHQRFPQSVHRVHHQAVPPPGHGIGGEDHPRGPGVHHLLNDDRHATVSTVT